jgi:hypothetical protein
MMIEGYIVVNRLPMLYYYYDDMIYLMHVRNGEWGVYSDL